MADEISIVNQKTRIEFIKSFFGRNLKKIIIIVGISIFVLLCFFLLKEYKEIKREELADKYNDLVFNNKKYDRNQLALNFKKIIKAKDKTYSPLSLYYIIDNELINNDTEINSLFDEVISINQTSENKNLIILKKAFFNSNTSNENEMLKIINPVINSEGIWKQHGLLLMAEYYFDKGELNKSKEFFNEVLQSKNINPKIKIKVEKKLKREFSE